MFYRRNFKKQDSHSQENVIRPKDPAILRIVYRKRRRMARISFLRDDRKTTSYYCNNDE